MLSYEICTAVAERNSAPFPKQSSHRSVFCVSQRYCLIDACSSPPRSSPVRCSLTAILVHIFVIGSRRRSQVPSWHCCIYGGGYGCNLLLSGTAGRVFRHLLLHNTSCSSCSARKSRADRIMLTSDPEEVFCSFEGPGEVAAPVSDAPRFMDPVPSVAPQAPPALVSWSYKLGKSKAVRYHRGVRPTAVRLNRF